jgi:hypothetical protein
VEQELRRAATVVVVLGDYEWEFDNALVAVGKRTVEIWHEDDEGRRRHVATTPLAATFIAWEGLEEFIFEEEDDDYDHEHDHDA